jgi:phospholipid/cholesterol/gamma-HCH transport system substrate-binding protein
VTRVRWWRRYDDVPASELGRKNPVRYGVVLLVLILIGVYFGFTKHIPFKHGFRLKAQFASALDVQPKSPVRIAGVNVGKVSHIERQGRAGLVTMELERAALPIHSDATAKLRPRTFLEGNWFVELRPGSPSAPVVSSGYTIPITQTANPVQLDQVLDALNSDTRQNLQNFLIGFGNGLTRKPTAADNAEQEPEVRGLNGAQALNLSYQRGPSALRGTAVLNQAITGTETHDLSKLVAGIGRVTAALNVHEQQLSELIVNFNAFFRSFATEQAALRAAVALLPSSLTAIAHGFTQLNAAFPPIRAFSTEILPGLKNTNSMVLAALPWIEQTQASLAPTELGGVAQGLEEATPTLVKLQSEQIPFYKQSELIDKCQTNVVFPAGNARLQDGPSTSGVEDYKEFWYSLVGLNSLGANFDGNGTSARFLVPSGGQTLKSAPVSILGTKVKGLQLLAHAALPPLGTRPAYPAEEPPYKPLVPCYKQTLPNFNGPLSQGPADGGG